MATDTHVAFKVDKPIIACAIMRLTRWGWISGIGIARMAPDDHWDLTTGRMLAFYRAEKDLYTSWLHEVNRGLRRIERKAYRPPKLKKRAPATEAEAKIAREKASKNPKLESRMEQGFEAQAEILRSEKVPNQRTTEQAIPEHGQVEVDPHNAT